MLCNDLVPNRRFVSFEMNVLCMLTYSGFIPFSHCLINSNGMMVIFTVHLAHGWLYGTHTIKCVTLGTQFNPRFKSESKKKKKKGQSKREWRGSRVCNNGTSSVGFFLGCPLKHSRLKMHSDYQEAKRPLLVKCFPLHLQALALF